MFLGLFNNCGLSCCLCTIFYFVVWTHNSHRSKGSTKTPWLRICRGEFGGTKFLINIFFPPLRIILTYAWLLQFEDAQDAEDAIRGRDGYDFDGHRLRVGYISQYDNYN